MNIKAQTLWTISLLVIAEWAVAQTGSAVLRVRCDGDSAGAEVSINGQFKGECPFDTKVPAGKLKIEARKQMDKNHEQFFEQEMRVGSDVVKSIEIVLGAQQLTAEAKRTREIEVETQRRTQAERDKQQRLAEEQAKADAQRRNAELSGRMQTAADGGDVEAMMALAQAYDKGQYGLPIDKAQAKALYDKATAAMAPGRAFRDCADCPEMVVIPAGRFLMGSSEVNERPQREVIVPRFAMGKHEVTERQWRRFFAATNHETDAERNSGGNQGCATFEDGKLAYRRQRSWRAPGFSQTETHPVVCVSWNDVRAYAEWLSRETGQTYRLPTEAEWEYAARAGNHGRRPWGDDAYQACAYANTADQTIGPNREVWELKHECNDGYFFTAPVGSYRPNAFGMYDMIGNVWEWAQDCYSDNAYAGKAPSDGQAFDEVGCSRRVMRGASWNDDSSAARVAYRMKGAPAFSSSFVGLRLARTLP